MTAAYGWTYSEIDSHTLIEVQELFDGWKDYTPTNILVKALVEGFCGKSKPEEEPFAELPPDAAKAMRQAALAEVARKAGPAIPIVRGKDRGLPQKAPVFDYEELRKRDEESQKRNNEFRVKRALEKVKKDGGE